MKKILFLATHRQNRSPSQRFRFEQYFSYLDQNGFQCTLSPLIINAKEDRLFYGNGLVRKMIIGLIMAFRRLKDVFRRQQFDIIFIARESFITGGTFFERALKKSRARIVYDFDDSVWIDTISEQNKIFAWLKGAGKTRHILQLSDLVIAGNEYLAQYARPYCRNVVVIPTTIDTEIYQPPKKSFSGKVIIGWSGSQSTIEHFKTAIPALILLKRKYGDRIDFKIIGDSSYRCEPLQITGIAWQKETELEELGMIDIGIMPLPDDAWTRGKCGLKGLQYMALQIPTVMSPVGVNKEIILDGINGFLAATDQEWVEKISLLVDSSELRRQIGIAGRNVVEQRFSVASQKGRYLEVLRKLLGE